MYVQSGPVACCLLADGLITWMCCGRGLAISAHLALFSTPAEPVAHDGVCLHHWHTLLSSIAAKPPVMHATAPICHHICFWMAAVRARPSRGRKLTEVRTASDIRPRKPSAMNVGCHEKSVPFSAKTGMLRAMKAARQRTTSGRAAPVQQLAGSQPSLAGRPLAQQLTVAASKCLVYQPGACLHRSSSFLQASASEKRNKIFKWALYSTTYYTEQ